MDPSTLNAAQQTIEYVRRKFKTLWESSYERMDLVVNEPLSSRTTELRRTELERIVAYLSSFKKQFLEALQDVETTVNGILAQSKALLRLAEGQSDEKTLRSQIQRSQSLLRDVRALRRDLNEEHPNDELRKRVDIYNQRIEQEKKKKPNPLDAFEETLVGWYNEHTYNDLTNPVFEPDLEPFPNRLGDALWGHDDASWKETPPVFLSASRIVSTIDAYPVPSLFQRPEYPRSADVKIFFKTVLTADFSVVDEDIRKRVSLLRRILTVFIAPPEPETGFTPMSASSSEPDNGSEALRNRMVQLNEELNETFYGTVHFYERLLYIYAWTPASWVRVWFRLFGDPWVDEERKEAVEEDVELGRIPVKSISTLLTLLVLSKLREVGFMDPIKFDIFEEVLRNELVVLGEVDRKHFLSRWNRVFSKGGSDVDPNIVRAGEWLRNKLKSVEEARVQYPDGIDAVIWNQELQWRRERIDIGEADLFAQVAIPSISVTTLPTPKKMKLVEEAKRRVDDLDTLDEEEKPAWFPKKNTPNRIETAYVLSTNMAARREIGPFRKPYLSKRRRSFFRKGSPLVPVATIFDGDPPTFTPLVKRRMLTSFLDLTDTDSRLGDVVWVFDPAYHINDSVARGIKLIGDALFPKGDITSPEAPREQRALARLKRVFRDDMQTIQEYLPVTAEADTKAVIEEWTKGRDVSWYSVFQLAALVYASHELALVLRTNVSLVDRAVRCAAALYVASRPTQQPGKLTKLQTWFRTYLPFVFPVLVEKRVFHTWNIRKIRIRGSDEYEWTSRQAHREWNRYRLIETRYTHNPFEYRNFALLMIAARAWSLPDTSLRRMSERMLRFWMDASAEHPEYQLSASRLYDREVVQHIKS